jgi:hypothetical protein
MLGITIDWLAAYAVTLGFFAAAEAVRVLSEGAPVDLYRWRESAAVG